MKRISLRLPATILGFLGITAAATMLSGCGSKPQDGWPERPGPKVLVSFAPYYCFATAVAGDDAVVQTLMTTAGPHHFNPTDRDAVLLHRANLFFVNGLGLEGEMPETLKRGSGNGGLKIVDLGSKLPADKLCEARDDDDHDEHGKDKDGHDEHHHAGGKDPHVWLSPDMAVIIVESIRDELKSVDPAHAANYDRRASEYVGRLRKLKEEGIAMLKDKKDRRMVTFHESLTYFARDFDLTIVGVVEKTPGSEPNDKQLKELIKLCADPKSPVRILTVEPQYSNSNSGKELVKELAHKGVQDPALVEFDTLETVIPDQLTPDWYETRMQANLKALAEKMK